MKKYINIMDTTFRDGLQSVLGGRVLMDDFFPAVESALDAGIKHFEFGGGARFQTLFFYLQENAFEMMDRFREKVGPDINLQTLSRGINTVMLDTGSSELIELHAKLFAKHGTTTIRNFDALNDVQNLIYSAEKIKHYGLKHEAVITLMDLPPNCSGAHDVPFYEKTLRCMLDSDLPFDSLCFKDASGTSSPQKVFDTISMARRIVGETIPIRFHTHETGGVSVSSYLAALEAGVDGIDLAAAPLSGGSSQPDILTMLQATKGKPYDLGGLEAHKILEYEAVLKEQLKEYFIPPEATEVSPLIPFSPMPGGALTANTQLMRDNGTFDQFPHVIHAMKEVVQKGGYGSSVTPVSQFYWQQAYANVMFGPWKQISPGYGKMVLGYFGKTPVEPDEEIKQLAQEKLKLKPTTESPLDIANRDPRKSIAYWKEKLLESSIPLTDENVFIAASCNEKGLEFLKGNSPLMIRKQDDKKEKNLRGEMNRMNTQTGQYRVIVDGKEFNVTVMPNSDDVKIEPAIGQETQTSENTIPATVSGNVWKLLIKVGDQVQKGDVVAILEAMKMEIEVEAPSSGTISALHVKQNDAVNEGQSLATIS